MKTKFKSEILAAKHRENHFHDAGTPPTYTPLVLLKTSWRRIRKPSRKTILNLHAVPNTREESVGAYLSGLPGKAACKSFLK